MATKEKRNPQLQKKNSFREMGGTQQFPSGNKGQANFVWPILSCKKKTKKGRKGNKKTKIQENKINITLILKFKISLAK